MNARALRWLVSIGLLGAMAGCVEVPAPRTGMVPPAGLGACPEWKAYTGYLQSMIRRIQKSWERILKESQVYPKEGTSVKVAFRMNVAGEIAEIVEVTGTAGHEAQRACVLAISTGASYGAWTKDMKAVLGDSQEMTFTFYYQ